jgi:hypothetical protein
LTLHQAGFTNTVALLGTEITSEQAAILKTLARNAILIFDGDAGGQAALLRALKTPSLNLTMKAVILPSGDPDEMVREGRLDEAVADTTFCAGMIKAPVFGAIIALTGTRRGLEVRESSRELGRLTTVAVVQSIFLVIFADALFAVFFLQIDF